MQQEKTNWFSISMIIIVSGLPGSGKTFFAQRLSERIDGVHLNSDAVRMSMTSAPQYSMKDRLANYREMASRCAGLLALGKTVVLDATFHHHAMRDIFMTLARETLSTIRFIEIQASEAVIRNRLAIKRKDSDADFGVYQKLKKRHAEPLTIPHLVLDSTDGDVERMLRQAIEYLEM